MLADKTTLTLEDIEAQEAHELQDRELMSLVTVVVAHNNVAVSACVQAVTSQSACVSTTGPQH